MIRLAIYSLAIAIVLGLVFQLPRRVAVLVISSVLGVFAGWVTLLGNVNNTICDLETRVAEDRCSGIYFGGHRLPQFMQGSHGDAWLLVIAGLMGALAVDLIVLLVMWGWSRVRRGRVPTAA
jgi:hypothetical protein